MLSISSPELNRTCLESSQGFQTKPRIKLSTTRHKKAKRLSGTSKLCWSLLIVLFSAMVVPSAFAAAEITLVTIGKGEHTDVSAKDYDALGEYLYYDYTITNTGTVGLAGPAVVTDPAVAVRICPNLTTTGNGDDILDVTETLNCVGLHKIVQADMDPPGEKVSTSYVTVGGTQSNTEIVTLYREDVGVLVTGEGPDNDYDAIGDVLDFEYVVTNYTLSTIGSVTYPIAIFEDAATDETCPADTLAAGASMTCTASHTVVAADISATFVESTSYVTAGDCAGDNPPANNPPTCYVTPAHELSLHYADPDLPGALATPETIPAGSLIIPMDTVLQSAQSEGIDFNIAAYGAANKLLQNSIPIKWAIRSDKIKIQGTTTAAGGTTTVTDTTPGVDFSALGVLPGDLLTNVSDGFATGEVFSVAATSLGIIDYTGTSIDSGDNYVIDAPDFDVNTAVFADYTVVPDAELRYTNTTISADDKDNKYKDSAKGFVTAGFRVGDVISVEGFTEGGNNIIDGVLTTVKADGGELRVDSVGDTMVKEDAGDSVTIIRAAVSISAVAPNTFEDSSGGFVAAGLEGGDLVTVTGFSNPLNNVVECLVDLVGATSLQLDASCGDTLVSETAGGPVTFTFTALADEASRYFYGGPFIVSSENPVDVLSALSVLSDFNANVAAYPVNAFLTTDPVEVDVRYTLRQRPFIAVSDIKTSIHTDILDAAGIPGGGADAADNCPAPEEPGYDPLTCNYTVIEPVNLQRLACATLHMEPHRNEPAGSIAEIQAVQDAVRAFVLTGGNFLAQCHAVQYFENTDFRPPDPAYPGYFLTADGINKEDTSDSYNYPNSPMPFSQFTGPIDGGQGGSVPAFSIFGSGDYTNKGHDHLLHDTIAGLLKASSGKLLGGANSGGNVFYLGGHEYGDDFLAGINGQRMALNAIFVPADRPTDCGLDFVEPSIEIEKDTNGSDADSAPGPNILVGDPVTWSYVVTNTGDTVLTGVAVSDDVLGPVTCPETALAAGEEMTCTVVDTAAAGQYANLGSVVGSSPGNTDDVSDSDPSHYFGADPSIDIEKATNGFDADAAPGPFVQVGEAVSWTYVVTNTGNVTLTSVGVTDSPVQTITCAWEGSSDAVTPAGTLSVGETVSCSAAGTATIGQYHNTGTATGTPPTGSPVNDTDDSHYFGASPGIEIVKTASPTTYATVGTTITYTFAVENIGNVALTSVDVTDPLTGLSAITCDGGVNPIASIAPAATVNCSATYVIDLDDINAGSVDNTATAEGECTVTDCPVSDTDDETITTTALPDITIVKTATPKTFTKVGDVITYNFVVTNNGALTLTGVDVADPLVDDPITCDGGANPIATILPGASVNCSVNYSIGTADVTAGRVDNTVTAVGQCTDEGNCPVRDTDDETVNAILINLTKTATSGPIYDKASGLYTVVYRVTATNGGTVGGVYDMVDDNFANMAGGINLSGTPVVVYVPGDDSLDNDPPGWPSIALAESIGAGKTESWDITAQFTLTPGGLDADARACVLDEAESGKGFYNSVLPTAGETDTTDNDDCVNLPDPDLDLSKQVETTENTGLNKFRVTYLVKVDNTGDGPGIFDINDVPGFGAGITLDGVPTVSYVAIDDSFTPTPVTAPAWTQIALNETIAGQSSESWRVVAEFDLDLTDVDYEANRECVSSEGGWVSGKGFFNSVAFAEYQEENLLNNKDCSDPDDPLINLSKTAAPAVYQGGGLFDVTYIFTAENQSTVVASYDLIDTLTPSPALTPTAIQAPTAYVAGTENDQDGTIESPLIGDFVTGATLVSGETLAAGASESWTITIRFLLDSALATAENANCIDDGDEAGYTGFNNLIMGSASETDFTDNEACVELNDGRIEIALELIPGLSDLFDFEGDIVATLGHGGMDSSDVWPGTYNVTTKKSGLEPGGWVVASFTCDDDDSYVGEDSEDLIATYNVNPFEWVRCTLVLRAPVEVIAVPVNNPLALLLLTLMLLATGWYFRPAGIRNR